ncbi:MAG: iron chelate uptake ABC transporter family permease subunit, partial [Microbacterium gubbeenense]
MPELTSAKSTLTRRTWVGVLIAVLIVLLAGVSLFIGASSEVTVSGVASGDDGALFLLAASRVPRTVALLLSGAALGIAGLIMQMLVRNKFVEPSTTGVTEFASLGMMTALVLWPGMAILPRMAFVSVFAL